MGPFARRLGRINRKAKEAADQARAWERLDLPDAWPTNLDESEALIERTLGKSADMETLRLHAGPGGTWRIVIYCFSGLVKEQSLEDTVLLPLRSAQWPTPIPERPDLAYLAQRLLTVTSAEPASNPQQALQALLHGRALLLLAGSTKALVVARPGFDTRPVDVPEIEPTLRGPREAFVEALENNLSLIRRRMPSPQLRAEEHRIGKTVGTRVVAVYLADRTPPSLIEEGRKRLGQIDTDVLLDSQPLAEAISESRWTPFPLYDQTERPDRAVAALLEGRLLFVVAGTPDAIIVPTTFWHLVQTAEDYFSLPTFATFARVMRILGMLTAFFLPSLYVALTTFHHEMIPTPLLLTLEGNRTYVPFPAVIEAGALELMFEALREAGLRLPRPAGQAISIVGALLLGEAAIRSNLVSPMMVIVVAVTGMASFTIPSYELSVAARLFRLVFLVFAGSMGLAGLMCAGVLLLFHVTSLRSFGISYFWPAAPNAADDPGDVLVRPPVTQSKQGKITARHGTAPLRRRGRL